MKAITRLLFIMLSLAFFVPGSLGAAQSTPEGLSITVQAGFEGHYKENTWLPVTVRLENTGAPIQGVLEITLDDYIQPDVVYRYPVELPTTSRSSARFGVSIVTPR